MCRAYHQCWLVVFKRLTNVVKSRLDFIDSLRGWAILGVIVTHVGSIVSYEGLLSSLVSKSGYGVQLFFIISAFTIFLTLDKARGRDRFLWTNFFTKRMFRIAPVYWAGIILYTAVFGLQSRGWLPGPEPWHFPMHFFFVNLLHPQTPSSVVPGGWSISCEVLFYALCPMLFIWLTNLRRAMLFSILSVGLGLLTLLSFKLIFQETFSQSYGDKLAYQYFYRSIFMQLGCFSFGIVLFHLYKQPKVLHAVNKKVGDFLLPMSLCIFAVVFAKLLPGAVSHYAFCVAAFLLALRMIDNRLSFFENRALIFLGRISYSGYIVHFIVIYGVNKWLGVDQFLPLLLASLALTIPLAYVLFQTLERGAISMAKHIVTRRENAATGLST